MITVNCHHITRAEGDALTEETDVLKLLTPTGFVNVFVPAGTASVMASAINTALAMAQAKEAAE